MGLRLGVLLGVGKDLVGLRAAFRSASHYFYGKVECLGTSTMKFDLLRHLTIRLSTSRTV